MCALNWLAVIAYTSQFIEKCQKMRHDHSIEWFSLKFDILTKMVKKLGIFFSQKNHKQIED